MHRKCFFLPKQEKRFYAKASETVSSFIEMDDKNFALLRNNLWRSKNIFQYVYSWIYPDIYCSTEQRGFNIKSSFFIVYKNHKDKKRQEHLRKKPQNFNLERQNTFEKEQKPLRIDDLNSNEGKRVKRKATKEKEKGVSKLKKTR